MRRSVWEQVGGYGGANLYPNEDWDSVPLGFSVVRVSRRPGCDVHRWSERVDFSRGHSKKARGIFHGWRIVYAILWLTPNISALLVVMAFEVRNAIASLPAAKLS
jgi:hypothetical protein